MSRSLAVAALWTVLSLPGGLHGAPEAAPFPEVSVETDKGSFVIRLRPDLAPAHVKLFLKTAQSGGYARTAFHRIVPRGIIQGGDPNTRDPGNKALYGKGGLGLLKAEFSDHPFLRGTVAAARRPSSVDSGGTQFFVCLSDQAPLLGQYTIFGEVVLGMEVVDAIGETPVEGQAPTARVEVKSVVLLPAPAAAP